MTGLGACAGRYERKGEWSNEGIYNYVLGYVSLWGPKCQTGVPTGDFARGILLFHSKWISVCWGEDLSESESVGQSIVVVCLHGNVPRCWGNAQLLECVSRW